MTGVLPRDLAVPGAASGAGALPAPDWLGPVLRSIGGAGTFAGWATLRPGHGRRAPGEPAIHLYAVARGAGLLRFRPGEPEVHLRCGDVAILPGGAGHALSARPAARSRDAAGARVAWARIPLGPGPRPRFLEELDPVLQFGAEEGRIVTWLHESLCLAADQSRRGGPGMGAAVDLVLEAILAQALRGHLASRPPGHPGPLAAVMDPAIGITIERMHAKPGQPWTVASLAREAGLSRSSYAERFSVLAGITPMQYLLGCRMREATRLLRLEPACLKAIAVQVGYASEPAFSAAFRRWSGRSPGAYRTEWHGSAP